MKTVKDACKLQPNALEIRLSDQVEKLEELIAQQGDGSAYFDKTFITQGMETLVREGIARLAGKSSQAVFHLKQAMGGGKTHSLVGLGLLARNRALRERVCSGLPHLGAFDSANVAAFNGRNEPPEFFWGDIARQLGHGDQFCRYWQGGASAPDEDAWLSLFQQSGPTLVLLDEMPPYFQSLATRPTGQGTVADIATRAFANMLTAAGKLTNVCVVVSDLSAAYQTGGQLIQRALADARNELGRQERSITPVDLATNEVYEILRKRLFAELPPQNVIEEIAAHYGRKLEEATRARTVNRGAEAIADEVAATYPFHPRLQNLIALFKENENFKQTRGLIELVSGLLKSVWERQENDVFLIGGQHFDLGIQEVRDKLADISGMRDVISRDLWSTERSAHAQVIDAQLGKGAAREIGTLLLTASLSTAVNSVKGLTRQEIVECLLNPFREASDYNAAFEEFEKVAWYLHHTQEGKFYFDRTENLTKLLQTLAKEAPDNQIDALVRRRLKAMFEPSRKSAYEEVLPLPTLDEARAAVARKRSLLIVSPDSDTSYKDIEKFFGEVTEKNNLLVLTGEQTAMGSLDKAARQFFAADKAQARIPASHAQRQELDKRLEDYDLQFYATVLGLFDRLVFPYQRSGQDPRLVPKTLDPTRDTGREFSGEAQVEKTLTSDPIKLYLDVEQNLDALREKAEDCLWPMGLDETRWSDAADRYSQNPAMVWLPPRKLDDLKLRACQQGKWEDLGNGYVTKKPRPKEATVQVTVEYGPDDAGKVRLRVVAINAGPAPRIHYAEEGQVTTTSAVLADAVLETTALRVQFLVVDPTEQRPSAPPYEWRGSIKLRCHLNGQGENRRVELFAAPRGTIRYTLDGTEPRNGKPYEGPISIGAGSARILVFARADDFETKDAFDFPDSRGVGGGGVVVDPNKPATLVSPSQPFALGARDKVYQALEFAQEHGVTFEVVRITLGQGNRSVLIQVGELDVTAKTLRDLLFNAEQLFDPSQPIAMTFRTARFLTGHLLKEFAKQFDLVLGSETVRQ